MTISNPDPRLIEPPVRLSQSKLWKIQENYFTQMGVNAWKEEVPFYISSNAFIGWHYANIVFEFMKDVHEHTPSKEPFYMLELGCGTGKFSFYFLRALNTLMAEAHQAFKFVYVLTDVSDRNLEFCSKNESFKPFLEQKQIDFALLNVETSEDCFLKIAQKNLSDLQNKHPLIVIANYTFDCVKHDAFVCFQGKVQEVRLGLRSRYKNFNIEKARHLDDLRLNYEYLDVDYEHYYPKKELNAILGDYAKSFDEEPGFAMMPISAFEFVDNIRKMNKHVFMIVGDKGLSDPKEFVYVNDENRVSYDGCYSFFLNFHALGEYIKTKHGDYRLTKNSNDFKVCLYSIGFSLDRYYQTNQYFNTQVEAFGPNEYCYVYDEYLSSSYRFNIKGLMSFLRMSHYDPNAYGAIHDRLIELVPTLSQLRREELDVDLNRIINNVYQLSFGENILNNIGAYYQKIGQEDKALELFLKSTEIYSDKYTGYHNAAMIYEKKKNIPKALQYYEKSYALNKRDEFANRKLHTLTGRFYARSFLPLLKGLAIFSLIIGAIYFMAR